MSLPQNLEPTEEPTPVIESVEVSEEDFAEDASDAQLRQWAKDNGIEGVPASGKLSATWREQITGAMADALNDVATALDPKGEDSAEATSSESSTLLKAKAEKASEEPVVEDKESAPAEPPVVEYHSVFEAPNTYVTSQAFTA